MVEYNGVEWCPYCEDEMEYDVDENTWIVTCKECGRPLVLCDKCYTVNGYNRPCGRCEYCEKAKEILKEWEKKTIGKRVYWNDPDNGLCSCFCTIIGFGDNATVTLKTDAGGIIDAYDKEIDWKKPLDKISKN